MEPEEVTSWATATAATLGALKEFVALIPKQKSAEAEQLLKKAERDFRAAEAWMANELGYSLCRRHWPPGILVEKVDGLLCSSCGQPQYSPLENVEEARTVLTPEAEAVLTHFALRVESEFNLVAIHEKISAAEARMHISDLSKLGFIKLKRSGYSRLSGRSVPGLYEIMPAGTRWLKAEGKMP